MNLTKAFANDQPSAGLAGFDSVSAAPEYTPLPPGIYLARVVQGEYTTTRAGDDAYRMKFEVTEGDRQGRSITRWWTFGPKALAYTKRDLAPFGLVSQAQLLSPFPEAGREYRVRLVVALQTGNDGSPRNDIKRIEVLSVKDSPLAPFALPPMSEGGHE